MGILNPLMQFLFPASPIFCIFILGFLTKASGSMGYMEVCLKVKNAGWVEVDDPEGPYAYR